jgi:hypothetical protein
MAHKRTLLFLGIALALIGLISITFKANARISFNKPEPPFPPKPPPPARSDPGENPEEGSVLMFLSLSKVFMAFAALEKGDISETNKLVKEASKKQQRAVDIYKAYSSQTEDRPLTIVNMAEDQLRQVRYDFTYYGLQIPKNEKELADITYKEVKDFADFVNGLSFGDNYVKNRQVVREIIDRLNRYMRLGISASEIYSCNR